MRRYEAIALLNGALVMVLEIVGARMVAPYFGSSIYVWTAVVGVILGGLSLGYWYGGKLADRAAEDRYLALILQMAAGVLLLTLATQSVTLGTTMQAQVDLRVKAAFAALLLFLPANFLMGMVSPYLAKLRLTSLKDAGSSVGRLYAAGTVGSIVGTFASGYWLISWFGNRKLGLLVVAGLLVASWLARPAAYWWQRLVVAALTMAALLWTPGTAWGGVRLLYDGDSSYQRLRVLEMPFEGQMVRALVTDNSSAESGISVAHPDVPAFEYIRAFLKAAEVQQPKRVLMIGGGAYVFPTLLVKRMPNVRVDVVEIDPKLDEVAAKYFGYKPDKRIHIIHEDGRTFLNRSQGQYDLVVMDAFNSTTPPFQLTTQEAVRRVKARLAHGGSVVVNLISARTGPEARFGDAEYSTYGSVFAGVWLGTTDTDARPANVRQNQILVAGNGEVARALNLKSKLGLGLVLTDDFAPVEAWTAQ
jgi:predicted O-methyltransferase YrrM